jgi:hypothetical protein
MRVKIFDSQQSFKGVLYNISKVSSDRAELMCAENFHALGILRIIKPEDYMDYLMSISISSYMKKPQLHAAISCKQEIKNKWELTDIAKQWLDRMNYGKQPYLIFFHYDTKVNHVHIVSSRVAREGKAINNSFEGIRSYSVLNQILGIDTPKQAEQDIIKALSYKFSSRMEFIMMLYSMGYVCDIKDGYLKLIRHGRKQSEISLSKIYAKITPCDRSSKRVQQLKEVFSQSLKKYDTAILTKDYLRYQKFSSYPIRCSSEFILQLKKDYNIDLIFHGRSRQLPTHYCIIDHQSKSIFEGSDIWSIEEFIRPVKNNNFAENLTHSASLNIQKADIDTEFKEATGISIGDFNIEILEEFDPWGLNKRKKYKKTTSQ